MQKENFMYEEKIYRTLPLQDLIIFGIYSIKKNNETATFERIVYDEDNK